MLVLAAGLLVGGAGCGRSASPSATAGTSRSGGAGQPGRTSAGHASVTVTHGSGHLPRPSHAGRDSFHGRIASATGAYAGDSGQVRIRVIAHGTGLRRFVTLTVSAPSCAGRSHCLALGGVMSGALTAGQNHTPDVGRGYRVTVAGPVRPLGSVTGSGQIEGTGFISRGRETLTITLTGSSGSVTLRALSPLVGGFTSP